MGVLIPYPSGAATSSHRPLFQRLLAPLAALDSAVMANTPAIAMTKPDVRQVRQCIVRSLAFFAGTRRSAVALGAQSTVPHRRREEQDSDALSARTGSRPGGRYVVRR